MKVGVIKEIKDKENRVALTPKGAQRLVEAGHAVQVQQGAGLGSGFGDKEYQAAGAAMVTVQAAWDADLVLKVKEPLPSEYPYLRDQLVFTYFHLAGVTRSLTEALLVNRTTAIAYETVKDAQGRLPLLAPMSAVAGNMAPLMGGYYLAKFNQGKGILLGQVLGERHGKVVVIGDGVVGRHAAKTATGMGADVFIIGRHQEREAQLKREISAEVRFVQSEAGAIARHLQDADLVVGAVLLAGAKAPRVVTKAMVQDMQAGSVIVDVSIDQGGCVETARPTSHSEPVYQCHGVIHYCVTNMPGAYPRTSTLALTNATLPYVLKLAGRGLQALYDDAGFAEGVNTCRGFVTYRPVAQGIDLMARFKPFAEIDID